MPSENVMRLQGHSQAGLSEDTDSRHEHYGVSVIVKLMSTSSDVRKETKLYYIYFTPTEFYIKTKQNEFALTSSVSGDRQSLIGPPRLSSLSS